MLLQALSKMYEEAVSLKDKNKKLASIEQLLQCVQSPCCPAYTSKTLLRALQDVHGEVLSPNCFWVNHSFNNDIMSFWTCMACFSRMFLSLKCKSVGPRTFNLERFGFWISLVSWWHDFYFWVNCFCLLGLFMAVWINLIVIIRLYAYIF